MRRLFNRISYRNFLKKLCRSLAPDVVFNVDDTSPVSFGQASNTIPFEIEVGMLGYKIRDKQVSSFLLDEIPNDMAICGIVTECHELFHVDQYRKEHGCQCDEDIFLSSIAYNNKNRKLYRDTYTTNIREIDAEYHGILMAYQYLQESFEEYDFDTLFVDYVNDRMSHSDYFINEPCYSMKDIVMKFDEAYERAKEVPQVYSSLYYQASDHIMAMMHLKHGYDSEWFPILAQFQNSSDYHDSVKKAASLMCYVHPEYYDEYPMLKTLNLSPEHVFGRSFPESQGVTILRVKQSNRAIVFSDVRKPSVDDIRKQRLAYLESKYGYDSDENQMSDDLEYH